MTDKTGNRVTVRIWGTRGSFAAALKDRMEFGGNTSCVSVEYGNRILVLDAGSGLASLGEYLSRRKHCHRIDLFLGHLHLDHIIGFLKFQPLFDPEMEIHVYGESRNGRSLRELLEGFMSPPWWPVGFDSFKARFCWHEVKAGECRRQPDGLEFSTFRANHPDQTLLYRFRFGDKSLMYGLDCEMDEAVWDGLAAFSRECSLLICDGHFGGEELELKKGWGHSSWEQAVRLRKEAGADRVMIAHYAWECTDEILRNRERAARAADSSCFFAREGMEVRL